MRILAGMSAWALMLLVFLCISRWGNLVWPTPHPQRPDQALVFGICMSTGIIGSNLFRGWNGPSASTWRVTPRWSYGLVWGLLFVAAVAANLVCGWLSRHPVPPAAWGYALMIPSLYALSMLHVSFATDTFGRKHKEK
ncbi:MAG: hypothetical protein JO250_13435 [Armatimonadetes bacterium]|nr:hypothetical protein [Armatimonadota bacterium]